MSSVLGWLTAPAERSSRERAIGLGFLRILAGALWLYNVVWKVPPDFGRESGRQLYGYVQGAVDDPLLPPYSWLLEQVVLPYFTFFGWAVLVVESMLAAFLLTGAYTRIWALVGVGQGIAIGLSVIAAPGEWPWGYYLLIGVHVVLFATAAGAYGGIDGVRASADPEAPWRALRMTSVVVFVAGAAALVVAFTDDLLAGVGPGIRSGELELSLGRYNVIGALLLTALGLLVLLAVRRHAPILGFVAAAVAAVATVMTWAQLSSGEVLLGGDGTSAAVFLTVAVAAGILSALTRTTQPAAAAPNTVSKEAA
jgi:hypothetical protein